MKRLILTLTIFIIIQSLLACTTAIVSARASKDGRPLLYKQRDTGFLDNKVVLFTDGLYRYMGIVNSDGKDNTEVWGGYNDVGFAIMNSASYNLNPKSENKNPELEGVVMKLALQKCKTLKDFENLLDTLPKPMYLSANFGVIDAYGGAAYYETSDYEYQKFDVNDSSDGYLIRTNFSYSGDRSRDLGLSRNIMATELFEDLYTQNNLSYASIHREVSRCLKHGITKVNLEERIPDTVNDSVFVPFRDFIPRYSTSSSIIVQGVKTGESSNLTIMWTMIGSPLTTVTIPLLITPDQTLPSIVQAGADDKSPLCNWSLTQKEKLFPITIAEGNDYLYLSRLVTGDKQGILQKILDWEDQIFIQSETYLNQWRKDQTLGADYNKLYDWITAFVTDKYQNIHDR